DKSGLPQKCNCLFDSVKRDRIYRFEVLLRRRVDPGENTDRMPAGSQGTGFCYMVSFFINAFRLCTFRTIADDTESFKLFSIWFYDITIVNKNNRIRGNKALYGMEIRRTHISRYSS